MLTDGWSLWIVNYVKIKNYATHANSIELCMIAGEAIHKN